MEGPAGRRTNSVRQVASCLCAVSCTARNQRCELQSNLVCGRTLANDGKAHGKLRNRLGPPTGVTPTREAKSVGSCGGRAPKPPIIGVPIGCAALPPGWSGTGGRPAAPAGFCSPVATTGSIKPVGGITGPPAATPPCPGIMPCPGPPHAPAPAVKAPLCMPMFGGRSGAGGGGGGIMPPRCAWGCGRWARDGGGGSPMAPPGRTIPMPIGPAPTAPGGMGMLPVPSGCPTGVTGRIMPGGGGRVAMGTTGKPPGGRPGCGGHSPLGGAPGEPGPGDGA